MRSIKPKNKNNLKKGQSMVETALILPIVILILMGIIDFGLMFNKYLIINNASREGARKAAVGGTDYEIYSAVSNVTSSLEFSNLTITIYPNETLRKKGEEVTVTVQYRNNLITPIVSAIVNKSLVLNSRTVMRVE